MKRYTVFEAKCEILRHTGVKPRKVELLPFVSDDNPDYLDGLTVNRLIEKYRKSLSSKDLVDLMWTHVLSQQGTCDFEHFCELVQVPNRAEVFSAIDHNRQGFITREDLLNFLAVNQ